MTVRIAAIPGSYREGSWNRKLLALAIREAKSQGAEIDLIDLRVLNLPVYDWDLEQRGFPESASDLKDRITKADGLLICSPEYNSSIPGGLKNAIDWASRPPHNPFLGKACALMGATPGYFGTVRMQPHLRQVLFVLGANLVTTSVLLPKADEAFDEEGELKEPARGKDIPKMVTQLLEAAGR